MIVTYGNYVLPQQQAAPLTGNQAYPLRYKGIWICLQVWGGGGRGPRLWPGPLTHFARVWLRVCVRAERAAQQLGGCGPPPSPSRTPTATPTPIPTDLHPQPLRPQRKPLARP